MDLYNYETFQCFSLHDEISKWKQINAYTIFFFKNITRAFCLSTFTFLICVFVSTCKNINSLQNVISIFLSVLYTYKIFSLQELCKCLENNDLVTCLSNILTADRMPSLHQLDILSDPNLHKFDDCVVPALLQVCLQIYHYTQLNLIFFADWFSTTHICWCHSR